MDITKIDKIMIEIRKRTPKASYYELMDSEELMLELCNLGAEIDDCGCITLYHRTTPEHARTIKSMGLMTAQEDGIFFSTTPNGQAEGYGNSVVQFRIPIEKVILDDIFDNEAHVKIPLDGRKRAYDVSKWIIDEH